MTPKTCVVTLEGHAQNISAVCFHPELPIILTGSEDSTVRVWHANTYRLETTLNYGLERVWAIMAQRGSNTVAIGYDEGSVIVKLGREEPAVSMDASGKGSSINYVTHVVKNKSYGAAVEFVWSSDANMYAVRESGSTVKIFKNFKETRILKPDFSMDGLFGGSMLGVRSSNCLCFYDWETLKLIRRIELIPSKVHWNESGELVALANQEAFFILKYNAEAVSQAQEGDTGKISEDGIEDAFEPIGEVQESVRTAYWIGDCFVYTTALNRLNYYVGGEIVTIAHLDRPMYLLGYIPKDSRLYLVDKDLNVVSYQLLLPVLEYQTAVMRRDFETADKVLPTVPRDQRTRVAHFLEKQGFKKQALAVSQDTEHRFDLALQLGELKTAYELAVESDSEEKWRQLSQVATARSELLLAGECLGRARDYGGLLLLASSAGSAQLMGKLAAESTDSGQNNVAFVSSFMLGKVDECLEILINTNRLPEAAFFARTYCPSQISRVVNLWKDRVAVTHAKGTILKLCDTFSQAARNVRICQWIETTHVWFGGASLNRHE